MSVLKEGDQAPDFTLSASNGKHVSLKDFNGKKNVVLYFYPKDDTPGCTVEACNFRDALPAIQKKDTVILGVSPDNIAAHEKFIKKFNLPFLLLSDPDKKVLNDYGVWAQKTFMGKKYMGVERTTFLIEKNGRISTIFRKVQPKNHHEAVLDSLNSLMASL